MDARARSGVQRRRSAPGAVVADDDDCVRALLAMSLTEAGFLVTQANDGSSLIDVVSGWVAEGRDLPVLVLTDVQMPHVNGLTVLPRLRQLLPEARLIVMSGSLASSLETSTLRAGADAFIRKPFRLEELLALIAALVAGAASPDGASAGGVNDGRRVPAAQWPNES